jgi:antitoxin component YwqK of YwqJK toxin-antitoxin module
MKIVFPLSLLALFITVACQQPDQKSESVIVNDSLSKIRQKEYTDSVKKTNPLLILPPDSTYTGDYIDRYPSGIIKFRGQFRFGERHGHWLSFFPNGELWSEMQYDKGLRDGPNKVMRPNGTVLYTGFYKNDKQDSIWDYFDESGKLAKKVEYKDDKMLKTRTY